MPGYRLYFQDESGHIVDRLDLNCPNDDAAIGSAKQLVNDQSAELWLLDRRVAIFEVGVLTKRLPLLQVGVSCEEP
jgi:hypothetical protein